MSDAAGHERCPTGRVDREIRVSPAAGAAPELQLTEFRHSPAFGKWLPDATVRIQAQFAPALLEAIAAAAGLTVTITPLRAAT